MTLQPTHDVRIFSIPLSMKSDEWFLIADKPEIEQEETFITACLWSGGIPQKVFLTFDNFLCLFDEGIGKTWIEIP